MSFEIGDLLTIPVWGRAHVVEVDKVKIKVFIGSLEYFGTTFHVSQRQLWAMGLKLSKTFDNHRIWVKKEEALESVKV